MTPPKSNPIQYDLKTGYPDTAALVPHEKLAASAQQLILSDAATQYAGDLFGPISAREQIAQFLTNNTTQAAQPDQLVLTAGAIAATDIVCRAVTQPGDVVVVENPTFFYMMNILRMSHITLAAAPMTPQGIDLDALAELVAQYGPRLKMVYTIPSYHNPTGINATPENRRRLVEMAHEHDFKIVEDTTYQWLYFDSPPPPLCRHYDQQGGVVISIGSFSKTIMPSLRLGWIWADSIEQARQLVAFKGDAAASALTAGMVGSFIGQGYYEAQLEHARSHYGERCAALVTALHETLPEWVEWQAPEGGYFVWLTLPEDLQAETVLRLSQARGADFMPGRASFLNGAEDRYLRLCFTVMEPEHLRAGAAIIADSIRAARG